MNWTRILLDGIFMSAVFNLATGLILAYDPVIFTTAYPKELQKAAPKNPKAVKHKLLFTLLVIVPVVLFGVFSAYEAGVRSFWSLFWTAYLEFFLINLGDFFGLDCYLRAKLGTRWELPNTHGHPCYGDFRMDEIPGDPRTLDSLAPSDLPHVCTDFCRFGHTAFLLTGVG